MSTDGASPSSLPGPGQRIGDYVIEGTLGQGAMGVVYRVRHAELGIERAIKFSLLGHDPQRAQRFEREALALARLDHPGVIRIHDYGLLRGYGYFVLDLVQGHDLEQELAERGPLNVSRSCTLGARVAHALAHVHAQGIVHRDLKPANILLRGQREPVLTDFGLARVAGAASLTRTQAVLGTPHYMSPEQIAGDGNVGPSADVFALGVVLYEWLSGELPFEGESLPTLAARILRAEPTPLRELRPEVPAALARVVARMLEKESAQRPRAEQVAAWLEACARGDDPGLGPGSRWTRLRRKHALGLALALSLSAIAGVGVAVARRSARPNSGLTRELAQGRHALANYERAARGLRLGEAVELDEGSLRAALEALPATGASKLEPERAALSARLQAALALSRFDRSFRTGELEAAAAQLPEGAGDEAWVLRRAALLVARGAEAETVEVLTRLARGLPSGSTARGEVWLQAARAAFHQRDAEAGRSCLERVEGDPVLTRAAARLRAQLDVQDALAGLDGGDEERLLEALRAARQRDPALGDAAARAVVDAILLRLAQDPERAVDLAQILVRVARGSHLTLTPRTADLFMRAASQLEAAGDWAGMARQVLVARRADPAVPIGTGLRQSLAIHGVSLAAAGQDREGLEVILAATHAGLEGLVTARQLRSFRESGLLDHVIAERPDEWAAYYWRAEAALNHLGDIAETPPGVLDELEDDVRRAGEGPDLPPELRTAVAAMALDVLARREGPDALIARARELRATGTHPEPWDLARRAALMCERTNRLDEAITWHRLALSELEAFRAEHADAESLRGVRFRYQGEGEVKECRQALLSAQLEAGDADGAERTLAGLSRAGLDEPTWLARRAQLRELQGRLPEALEDIDRALEIARGSTVTTHMAASFQEQRWLILARMDDPRADAARAELRRLGDANR